MCIGEIPGGLVFLRGFGDFPTLLDFVVISAQVSFIYQVYDQNHRLLLYTTHTPLIPSPPLHIALEFLSGPSGRSFLE